MDKTRASLLFGGTLVPVNWSFDESMPKMDENKAIDANVFGRLQSLGFR